MEADKRAEGGLDSSEATGQETLWREKWKVEQDSVAFAGTNNWRTNHQKKKKEKSVKKTHSVKERGERE